MSAIYERLAAGRTFVRLLSHPSGLTDAVRTVPPTSFGEGYEDAFPRHDEVVITAKHITASKTFEDREPGLGRIVFLFHLQGHRIVDVPSLGRRELRLPTLVIYYHAEGAPRTSVWTKGDTETSILIGFWPSRPPKIIEKVAAISEFVQQLIPRSNDPSFWLEFPLTLDMERSARQIVAPTVHQLVIHDFLSAKADELLCLGLDAALVKARRAEGHPIDDGEKLDRAIKVIEENFRTTPTMGFISEQIKAHPTVISNLFLERFGCTISMYCARKRMEMANRLLQTTEMPLKQVAYEVGYNHVANFNLAFRRTFGVTPAHARRGDASAIQGSAS